MHLSTDSGVNVVGEFFGRSAHDATLFLQLQQQSSNAHKVLVERHVACLCLSANMSQYVCHGRITIDVLLVIFAQIHHGLFARFDGNTVCLDHLFEHL